MIKLILADITTLHVDAIVNAANSALRCGGGVDFAIHQAAGPRLGIACSKLGGCHTGQAKITSGYNLPAKYVIHTVGPIYSGRKSDPKMLSLCYINSLGLAKENGIHSIAFPSISTRAYGYPKQEAANIAIRTVKKCLNLMSDYDIDVTFCCYDQETYDIYKVLGETIGVF